MPGQRRFLILAEGNFGPLSSKTANAALRYIPREVAAILDSTSVSTSVQEVLGFGGTDVPIVATFEEGMKHNPNALLIGIAPSGGQFPVEWRPTVLSALNAGLDVWSGLHSMLGDDAEFAAAAKANKATIRDLRRAPADLTVSKGRLRDAPQTIVLTVGMDCNMGKMTTQLQVIEAVRAKGHRVNFAATGQTGILIEGRGIGVDAVIADFIGGAAERLTLEASEGADIVLVEGQGGIMHPSYSGVTLGLLHGSMPHAMIMCAQPSRTRINGAGLEWTKLPSVSEMIKLYEINAAPLRESPTIAVAVNTFDLSEQAAQEAIKAIEKETGLPTTDPVRYSPEPIAAAIDQFHRARVASRV
ncbi:MAG: DUF1611 domain-containing protein [Gemmatimonadaceae bacterium]